MTRTHCGKLQHSCTKNKTSIQIHGSMRYAFLLIHFMLVLRCFHACAFCELSLALSGLCLSRVLLCYVLHLQVERIGYLYVVPIICSFGVLFNICTVVVLSRKGFQGPSVLLLKGLACADIVTTAITLPFGFAYCVWVSSKFSSVLQFHFDLSAVQLSCSGKAEKGLQLSFYGETLRMNSGCMTGN